MYFLRTLSLALGFSIFISACQPGESNWTVRSPSGNLVVNVRLDELQSIIYEVSSSDPEKVVLIEPSPLGIEREDVSFSSGLSFVNASDIVSINESYTMTSGKQSSYSNEANELSLTFKVDQGDQVQLIFRAFDDGVAFRYHFPEENSKTHTIVGESSGFNIPKGSKAWIQPYDSVFKWAPAYERYFENKMELGTEARFHNGWAFPALFQLNSHWVMLAEADIDAGNFGSHLNNEIGSNLYSIRMPEEDEALNTGDNKARSTLPWKSPWRVIFVGKDLGDIVESNLITDLSRPAKFEDTSWISPGKSSWSWWSDASSSKDFNKLKNFIDLSAEMGWKYSLVDANWNIMEGGSIKPLVDYANEKGVGILMWYNSGGPHNTVTEQPRDIMSDPVKRKAEFKKLQEWGVKGVKVDFFQSDKQHIIQQYLDIMEDAAAHHIMTNFHGCTIPRGWRRTYPNFMTMESVRGGECYQFDPGYPPRAPQQNTILPFTRNVIGPMDYTPVTFSNNQNPHITSNPHEAALGVIFESGLQHMADAAESYRSVPKEVKEYLKALPVSWDETRFIAGYPGKEVIMARRKDDTWYIGGINGEDKEKDLLLNDFGFLQDGKYQASIIKDADSSHDFAFDNVSLDRSGQLKIRTLPNGGFVAVLKPSE